MEHKASMHVRYFYNKAKHLVYNGKMNEPLSLTNIEFSKRHNIEDSLTY